MNWLLILVILLIAGNMAWGFCQGFLRVVYSVAAWIVLLVLVTWATPFVAELLAEHTGIDERIEAGFADRLQELVRGEAETGANEAEESALSESGIRLPDAVLDKLAGTGEMADQLLEGTGIYAKAAEEAGSLAMRAVSFVIVLLIAMLAFHILSSLLDLIARLPVIGEVNHVLGGVAGLIKGALLVWLAFAFIALAGATSVGAGLIGLIYESEVLVLIYENNLVLAILLTFL